MRLRKDTLVLVSSPRLRLELTVEQFRKLTTNGTSVPVFDDISHVLFAKAILAQAKRRSDGYAIYVQTEEGKPLLVCTKLGPREKLHQDQCRFLCFLASVDMCKVCKSDHNLGSHQECDQIDGVKIDYGTKQYVWAAYDRNRIVFVNQSMDTLYVYKADILSVYANCRVRAMEKAAEQLKYKGELKRQTADLQSLKRPDALCLKDIMRPAKDEVSDVSVSEEKINKEEAGRVKLEDITDPEDEEKEIEKKKDCRDKFDEEETKESFKYPDLLVSKKVEEKGGRAKHEDVKEEIKPESGILKFERMMNYAMKMKTKPGKETVEKRRVELEDVSQASPSKRVKTKQTCRKSTGGIIIPKIILEKKKDGEYVKKACIGEEPQKMSFDEASRVYDADKKEAVDDEASHGYDNVSDEGEELA